MKRRGVADVVSVRSVIDDGEGGVAEALAKPMNDYLVVLQMPADVKRKSGDDDKYGDDGKSGTDAKAGKGARE